MGMTQTRMKDTYEKEHMSVERVAELIGSSPNSMGKSSSKCH
jgi:hypothetical protein